MKRLEALGIDSACAGWAAPCPSTMKSRGLARSVRTPVTSRGLSESRFAAHVRFPHQPAIGDISLLPRMCKSLGELGFVASAHLDREPDPRFHKDVVADASARVSTSPRSRLAFFATAGFRSSPDFARFWLLNHGPEGYLHKCARR